MRRYDFNYFAFLVGDSPVDAGIRVQQHLTFGDAGRVRAAYSGLLAD
jgi:hypothetical protein